MNIPMPPRIERNWHDLVWFPRDYQRDQLEIDTEELQQHSILKWEGEDYDAREQQNEPWRQLAGVVPDAETLHRFTDTRWVPFEGKPLPDGSNIGTMISEDGMHKINGSRELQKTFALYRGWLQFLHLESLISMTIHTNTQTNAAATRITDDTILQRWLTGKLFKEAASIRRDERKRVSLLDSLFKQYDPDPSLSWIFHWRRSVVNQLHYILAAARWAGDTAEDTEEHAMLEEFENFSPMHQVIVAIVYKEASFEKRLRIMHVEDQHFMKRIRLVKTAYMGILGRNHLRRLEEKYLNKVLNATRAFQEEIRNLFSFRQLRDWGYGRPWTKMHLIFDTQVRPQFQIPVDRIRNLVRSNDRAKDLFGVHPIEKTSLKDACMVCLEEWLDHDLAIETYCKHFFHAACLVRYWDQEFSFDFRCPLCRASPGRIRDRVSFPAERADYGQEPEDDLLAYDTALDIASDGITSHPHIRPMNFTPDVQFALGRQMEALMLQSTLRSQELGGFLPLP